MPGNSSGHRRQTITATAILVLLAVAVSASTALGGSEQATTKPTVAETRAFVEQAERRLLELSIKADRASWVQLNFRPARKQLRKSG